MDVIAPAPETDHAVRPVVRLRTRRNPLTVRIALPSLERLGSPNALALGALTLFLTGFGLVMVLSASSVEAGVGGNPYSPFLTQGLAAFLGTGAMFVLSRRRPGLIMRAAPILFAGAVLLQLIAVFTPLGIEVNGNRNWLRIAGQSVQPSEFVKLGLVLVIASFFAHRRPDRLGLKGLLPVIAYGIIAIAAVYAGHDLGTCLIIGLIVLSGLFISGVRLPVIALLFAVAGAGFWMFAQGRGSRVDRLSAWGSGCHDLLGTCWQTTQAQWALANGGVFGVGVGNSVSKWFWLPEADNDFILAVIGEETGLIGLAVLIACFVAIAVVCLRITTATSDRFTRAAAGMTLAWLVGQGFANIAVVLGMLPVFGVPLPFVSAGGSSMIANLLAVGCVMAMANASVGTTAAAAADDGRMRVPVSAAIVPPTAPAPVSAPPAPVSAPPTRGRFAGKTAAAHPDHPAGRGRPATPHAPLPIRSGTPTPGARRRRP